VAQRCPLNGSAVAFRFFYVKAESGNREDVISLMLAKRRTAEAAGGFCHGSRRKCKLLRFFPIMFDRGAISLPGVLKN
jgi:hypothetical protein